MRLTRNRTITRLPLADENATLIERRDPATDHDKTRVRLWKVGNYGDQFDVLTLREFEERAIRIQDEGGEVIAGMTD